jgi:hypothetical protein
MRLKFFGQRGHWNRWPEAVGVDFGLVGSFGGRFVEPPLVLVLVLVVVVVFFPAFRLLLLLLMLGGPSISISGIAQTSGGVGVEWSGE